MQYRNCLFQIENLTVSFSDGRALCFLLHHYYPSFLRREDISGHTTVAASQSGAGAQPSNLDCSLDDSFGAMTYSYGRNPKLYEQMLNNEKKNFKIFHEKVSCEKTRGRPHSYYFIRDVTKFKLVLSLEFLPIVYDHFRLLFLTIVTLQFLESFMKGLIET